jgi:hypothetical protein
MEEVTSLLARPRLPDRARVMSAIDFKPHEALHGGYCWLTEFCREDGPEWIYLH